MLYIGLFLRVGSFFQILVFLVMQTPNCSLGTGNVEMKDCSVSEIQFPDLSCAHRAREIGKVSVSDHGRKVGTVIGERGRQASCW